VNAVSGMIDALDLDVVRRKLVLETEAGGYGWPERETDDAIRGYRQFLKQVLAYRTRCNSGDGRKTERGPAPDPVTDIVWHTHILFTEKYHSDCDRLFGEYIHHRPRVEGAAAADHHPVGG